MDTLLKTFFSTRVSTVQGQGSVQIIAKKLIKIFSPKKDIAIN